MEQVETATGLRQGGGAEDRERHQSVRSAEARALVPPRLTASVPTLASLSFEETVAFYERLGFVVQFRDVGLIGLARDGVRLHFWLTGNRRVPQSTSCWIDVAGIDALFEIFVPLGIIHRRGRLQTKPWGMREFDVVDCHGNLIRFCEPVVEAG